MFSPKTESGAGSVQAAQPPGGCSPPPLPQHTGTERDAPCQNPCCSFPAGYLGFPDIWEKALPSPLASQGQTKWFSLLKKVLQRWAESPQCTRSSLLQAAATGSVSSYPTGITACSPLDTAPGPVPPSPSPPYLGPAPGFGNSQGWKGPGQSRSWCWRSQGLTGAQPAVTKASL